MENILNQSAKVRIAKRVADELIDGQVVNLGVGIPTLIPDYLGDKQIFLHSENGLLGMGPTPDKANINMDLISASKQPITMEPGAYLFDSATSFAIIRGGHIDVAVLGTLQVNRYGEIANWAIPGKEILGVGGAMDLVAGVKKIIVASTHQTKYGEPKLVNELTFPSSGANRAKLLITEHAVFRFCESGPVLTEILSEISIDQLKQITGTPFTYNEHELKRISI